jgi:pimeloyl-ACP methyl ester carboxylesterase
MAMNITSPLRTKYLTRPEGRIAYDDQGEGPLVVCLPGMGDLRSTFRFQTPVLIEAGYRVVTVDLRGHGDSDTTFASFDDHATASDLIALVSALGQPAFVIGNSMGAAASVLAATERPELFRGLVLVGPFVRNPSVSKVMTAMLRVLMARPWARHVWNAYLPTLYAGHKPADFAEHRSAMMAAMARPGYTRAFSRTTRSSHADSGLAAARVNTPSLVLMGTLDPDYPDPAAEASWIADTVGGDVVMVEDAGHYPQSQQPEVSNAAVLAFLASHGTHA